MEAAEVDNFDDAFSDETSPAVGRSHIDTHTGYGDLVFDQEEIDFFNSIAANSNKEFDLYTEDGSVRCGRGDCFPTMIH